jgi:hypothetical protein
MLSWNNVAGADQYLVYRCSSAACTPVIEHAQSPDTNGTPFVDAWNLVEGATYRYRIRAEDFDGGGLSDFSNTAEVNYACAAAPSSVEAAIVGAPPHISSGGYSTILWSSSGADSCTVTGPGGFYATGTTNPPGGAPTGPLTESSTYTIVCVGNGTEATASVTITLTPAFEEL